jgi:hypothetical protein
VAADEEVQLGGDARHPNVHSRRQRACRELSEASAWVVTRWSVHRRRDGQAGKGRFRESERDATPPHVFRTCHTRPPVGYPVTRSQRTKEARHCRIIAPDSTQRHTNTHNPMLSSRLAGIQDRLKQRRRQALLTLLIALAISRSAPFDRIPGIDRLTLKAWRDARRRVRDERRRRDLETPLCVTSLRPCG